MQKEFDDELGGLLPISDTEPRVLLAVSGGIDSMCMANLFLKSSVRTDFAVAHVNFSLRGEESDGDEMLVRQWCSDNGVQFYRAQFDTHSFAHENSISTQMAARSLRYNWFNDLMDEKGYEYLSIAHNLNDSVETLFLNLLRGTGLNGLSGIKRTNGRIIRPLLRFQRSEIVDFVRMNGILYRDDTTNSESHYLRNRIRNEVFPHFSIINPSFLSTIGTSMKRFAEVGEIMDERFRLLEGTLYSREDNIILINLDRLREEKCRNYWLFRILSPYGFNDSQMSQIDISENGQSGKIFKSQSHVLVRDRSFLKVYPNEGDALPKVHVTVMRKPAGFDPRQAPAGVLYLDCNKFKLPVKCRVWQPADRFKPFGMTGCKKVSDFLTDLKLDVEQKKREIVVTAFDRNGSEQIICIAGRRIDDRFKVTEKTFKLLKVTID